MTTFTRNVKNYMQEMKLIRHHKHRKKKFCFFCKSQTNSLILIIGVYILVFSIASITLITSVLRLHNWNETEQDDDHSNRSNNENDELHRKVQVGSLNSLFSKRLFKDFKWPIKSSEFNCSHLSDVKKFNYLTSGWTKSVFSFEYSGKKYALKAVNMNGMDIKNCYEKHSLKTCYEKATLKMYKEYILSKELYHKTIIEVLAWCVSSNEFSNEVAIITELCSPIDVILLLRLSFSQRLKIMLDLSELLVYLQSSPLGSIAINDFQRQQFVLCKNTLKLTDLDDLSIEEPRCNNSEQCNKKILENWDNQINPYAELQCVDHACVGYNAKQNVKNVFRHFVNLFLNITTPSILKEHVNQLFYKYQSTWDAKTILKATEDLYFRYKQLNINKN